MGAPISTIFVAASGLACYGSYNRIISLLDLYHGGKYNLEEKLAFAPFKLLNIKRLAYLLKLFLYIVIKEF